MSNPWKCTNSGTSVLLTTFTVTGTPSFIRRSGPGEVPLYPMVLRMRLGASSTVIGAICRVKSVLVTSSERAGARKDWSCRATSRLPAPTSPAILRKSRRCIGDAEALPTIMVPENIMANSGEISGEECIGNAGGFMYDTEELVPAQDLAATNKAHYPNESAEYRAARNELIVEEIELRRHLERVASQRRALPAGGEIPQDFLLASETGLARFSSLFGDKQTLMIYSMMYGPQRKAPCPM